MYLPASTDNKWYFCWLTQIDHRLIDFFIPLFHSTLPIFVLLKFFPLFLLLLMNKLTKAILAILCASINIVNERELEDEKMKEKKPIHERWRYNLTGKIKLMAME